MKDSFWAMPIYSTDISQQAVAKMWSFIVQKIMWLTGQRVLTYGSAPYKQGSTTDKTLPEITQDFISRWQCKTVEVFTCIMEMVKSLTNQKLIDSTAMLVLHEWLHSLTQLGYEIKPRESGLALFEDTCSGDVIYNPIDYSQTVYTQPHRTRKPYIPANGIKSIQATHSRLCSKHSYYNLRNSNNKPKNSLNIPINFTHPWIQFENILLVVTYNNPLYETVQYVETMHRPFFPFLIHCGPGVPDMDNTLYKLKDFVFSFYSYKPTPEGHAKGAFNYECIAGIINMHYPVEGYLVMSDDMMISIFKLFDLPRHMTWFLPKEEIITADVQKLKTCRLGMCDFYPHWKWWEDYQSQTLSLLARLEREQHLSPLVHKCYRQLLVSTGGKHRAHGGFSDFYYIPYRLAKDFASLLSIFREEDVFLEITIPTIIRCLELQEDIITIRGSVNWMHDRDQPWIFLSKKHFLGKSFLHPTKWSFLAEGAPDFKKFFCEQVMPYLHDQFGRLT